MACRDGFVTYTTGCKQYCSMVVGVKLVKIWVDFFGWKISHFWSVLERLSVVWLFLLSSTTVLYEDSDSESESSQKIRGKKFERGPGRPHGDENHGKFENFEKLMKFDFSNLFH